MGSPITFSGFNSIDFNQILNAVMAQERQPLTRLQTQKSTLESQNTAFGTLAGKLATLEAAAASLKADDSLSFLSATSSDTGVGVSATTGSVTGTYDIKVTELARSQVTSSLSTYGAATAVVGSAGSLTITSANGDPATVITLTGSTTLQGLADKINAVDTAPVSASIVQTSPGVYTLLLASKETGSTNSFTVSGWGTIGGGGGAGLTFTDTNTDGLAGNSALDNSQTALDAAFTVNGLSVTSSSNTVTDVIQGVTLSLLKKDPATTATVRVARDESKAKDLLKKFINAYNDITQFAKDQSTIAQAGRASIGRDPLLRSMRETLRNAVMDEYTGGTFERLAEIGVGFDMTGKMILEDEVFDNAIETSPSAVQQLISGTTGDGGAFGALHTVIDDYTTAGGLVSTIRERITDQVSAMSKRLDSMEANMEVRRAALQREYIAADLAMTRLKSQSASLSSVSSGYRLF